MNKHRTLLLAVLALALLSNSCNDKEVLSPKEMAERLLSGIDRKEWIMESFDIDGASQNLGRCDSSYILTLFSDKTWEENYLSFACFTLRFGIWEVNEEGNVLKNTLYNYNLRRWEVYHYEILSLTEDSFTYRQVIFRNRFKTVVLRKG